MNRSSMSKKFQAFRVKEVAEKQFATSIESLSTDDLPAGDILIKVHFSSLNFKDALSASGNKGVTRKFPHTPGIDAAGEVVESSNTAFKKGDKVLVTGFDLGMNTWGGMAEYIRVPAEWVVALPDGLGLRESMVYGTAGLTAGLSVYQLINQGINPDMGKIVVTGASGGVGSMAVAILGKLGFEVVAVTGKESAHDLLKSMGAKECVGRDTLNDESKRPLLKPLYAGAIDTVGGNMLATILKSLQYNGVATCCGLVNSPSLNTSVFPFILKGVRLIGIDSVECDIDLRKVIWNNFASDWKIDYPEGLIEEVKLEGLADKIASILKGQIAGRVVVSL